MAFRILTGKNLSMSDLKSIVATQRGKIFLITSLSLAKTFNFAGVLGKDVTEVSLDQQSVSFDQFCSIMAEFKMRESESGSCLNFQNSTQFGLKAPLFCHSLVYEKPNFFSLWSTGLPPNQGTSSAPSTALVPVGAGMWGWMNTLANQTAVALSDSFCGLIGIILCLLISTQNLLFIFINTYLFGFDISD
jgi:hypothetical protein